jgi:hypothetical protein
MISNRFSSGGPGEKKTKKQLFYTLFAAQKHQKNFQNQMSDQASCADLTRTGSCTIGKVEQPHITPLKTLLKSTTVFHKKSQPFFKFIAARPTKAQCQLF